MRAGKDERKAGIERHAPPSSLWEGRGEEDGVVFREDRERACFLKRQRERDEQSVPVEVGAHIR